MKVIGGVGNVIKIILKLKIYTIFTVLFNDKNGICQFFI